MDRQKEREIWRERERLTIYEVILRHNCSVTDDRQAARFIDLYSIKVGSVVTPLAVHRAH